MRIFEEFQRPAPLKFGKKKKGVIGLKFSFMQFHAVCSHVVYDFI